MKKTVGIIGCGNMGTAILSRIRKDFNVLVCEQHAGRAQAIRKKFKVSLHGFSDLIAKADVLIIAVKPQDIDAVLEDVKTSVLLHGKEVLIISIAAGIPSRYIERKVASRPRVIRAMPNLPAQIACGITALAPGEFARPADLKTAKKIFGFVGETVVVDERLMDAVTAVSGSGPAYVFFFVECFLTAARNLGIEEELAKKLVGATLRGSVDLLEERAAEPAALRAGVTSKGGTTQAAVEVLLKGGFERMMRDALLAAKERAKQLSRR